MIGGTLWIALSGSILSGLLSSLHFALRGFNRRKLEELAGDEGMKRMEPVLRDIDGHVLAVGFLRVVCNVAIVVSMVLLFGAQTRGMTAHGLEPDAAITLGVWRLLGAVAAASGLLYVFSFVIPMSVADHFGERLLLGTTGFVRLLHSFAIPIRVVRLIDLGVRRLAGAHHVTEAEEHKEELLSVVTEGERGGNIDESEREMIEAVVEFGERTVEEIMTPRTEIEGFELTDNLAFVRQFIEKHGHSRIPVYENDYDHIVGILYAKDLIKWVGRDASSFKLRSNLRPAIFVPESKPLGELLNELRAKKVHIAIVLNEYGSTVGLVTFEDLLEEIVGEIHDEYEPIEETLSGVELDESTHAAEIEAREYITDANKALEPIGVELPEGEDYDTVGGYVLATFGHIPVAGETFRKAGHIVTVLEAEPMRVIRVKVERAAPEAAEGEQGVPESAGAASDTPSSQG